MTAFAKARTVRPSGKSPSLFPEPFFLLTQVKRARLQTLRSFVRFRVPPFIRVLQPRLSVPTRSGRSFPRRSLRIRVSVPKNLSCISCVSWFQRSLPGACPRNDSFKTLLYILLQKPLEINTEAKFLLIFRNFFDRAQTAATSVSRGRSKAPRCGRDARPTPRVCSWRPRPPAAARLGGELRRRVQPLALFADIHARVRQRSPPVHRRTETEQRAHAAQDHPQFAAPT